MKNFRKRFKNFQRNFRDYARTCIFSERWHNWLSDALLIIITVVITVIVTRAFTISDFKERQRDALIDAYQDVYDYCQYEAKDSNETCMYEITYENDIIKNVNVTRR